MVRAHTKDALIWATVSPDGPDRAACCPLCIDHGVFNRLVGVDLSLDKAAPILDFLKEQGVPFRILLIEAADEKERFPLPSDWRATRQVEIYPRQGPAFLETLANLIN